MAGPSLWLKGELRPAVKGAEGATAGSHWRSLIFSKLPVVGRNTLSYWQGFRVRIEQGMGCV